MKTESQQYQVRAFANIMGVMKRNLLIWTVLLLCSIQPSPAKQQYQISSQEELIAAYVYRLSQSVAWEQVNNSDSLSLMFWGSDANQISQIQQLSERRIANRALRISSNQDINQVLGADIIVVEAANNERLRMLFDRIDRQPTLVITIDSPDQTLTHFNLISSENSISFEVNRYTLAYNNLPVSIDVMVLGGREVDIALLLKQMQAEVAEKELKLAENQKQLEETTATVEEINQQLSSVKSQLETEQNRLNELQSLTATLQQERDNLSANMASLSIEVNSSKAELANQSELLRERESAIATQNQLIVENEAKLQQQADSLLSQQQTLEEQTETISTQGETINESVRVISTQSKVIWVFAILIALIVIGFIISFRQSRRLHQLNRELIETKDQLVESEKMASLGFLVSGIAHELNTPIGAAITASSIVEDALDKITSNISSAKPSKRDLSGQLQIAKEGSEIIKSNQDRAALLINRFKELSVAESDTDMPLVNLAEFINAAIGERLKRDEFKVIDCKVVEQAKVPVQTRLNRAAMFNVCGELMDNTLKHAVDRDSDTKLELRINISETEKHTIIRFSHNGLQIPEKDRDHIFEPFYTTKRNEGSVGLGLHMCHIVVSRQLNGSISYHNEGKITWFTISLPKGTG